MRTGVPDMISGLRLETKKKEKNFVSIIKNDSNTTMKQYQYQHRDQEEKRVNKGDETKQGSFHNYKTSIQLI